MSTLQVANVHLESTGNNRIEYAGSNSVNIVAGGANTLTVNSTSLLVNGTIVANGFDSSSTGRSTMTVYNSPGTWSNSFANLKYVKLTVIGGGGGGGRGSITPSGNPNQPLAPFAYTGGGGGGGGVAIGYYNVSSNPALSAPVSVTVGAGGRGTNVTVASLGGDTSSFGALATATGGGAGANGSDPTPGAAGSGGTGSGGSLNISGAAGFRHTSRIAASGDALDIIEQMSTSGGQPFLTNQSAQFQGANGFIFGGGGAGGTAPSPTRGGGAGANGVVIVEEFY